MAGKDQHAQRVFEVVRILVGGGTEGAIPGTDVDGIGIGIRERLMEWPDCFRGGIVFPEPLSLFVGFVNLRYEICLAEGGGGWIRFERGLGCGRGPTACAVHFSHALPQRLQELLVVSPLGQHP